MTVWVRIVPSKQNEKRMSVTGELFSRLTITPPIRNQWSHLEKIKMYIWTQRAIFRVPSTWVSSLSLAIDENHQAQPRWREDRRRNSQPAPRLSLTTGRRTQLSAWLPFSPEKRHANYSEDIHLDTRLIVAARLRIYCMRGSESSPICVLALSAIERKREGEIDLGMLETCRFEMHRWYLRTLGSQKVPE